MKSISWKVVVITVAIPTVGFALYRWLRPRKRIRHTLGADQVRVELKIPMDKVGAVIGKGGSTIKEIQDTSGTIIKFRDFPPVGSNNAVPGQLKTSQDTQHRLLLIRGREGSVQVAERIVRKILAETAPTITEDVYVPRDTVGFIIGKHGVNIRELSRLSGVRINVDSTGAEMEVIHLRGQPQAIECAKHLLKEKVDEERVARERRARDNEPMLGGRRMEQQGPRIRRQNLRTSLSEPLCEVYVSAVFNPNKFWLQRVQACVTQLSTLTEEITAYYSAHLNAPNDGTFRIGDFVAAPLRDSVDGALYRAQIFDLRENEQGSATADITYVDFGDGDDVPVESLQPLQSHFVNKLPFQAVECTLQLRPSAEDNAWSEKAIAKFEELTFCQQSKPVLARLVCVQHNVHVVDLEVQGGEQLISVGEEMIRLGYAHRI